MKRSEIVKTAKTFDGAVKGSAAHHKIVDLFNQVKPDGYTAGYNDHWCAEYVSAVFIKALGPVAAKKNCPFLSASCGRMQQKAAAAGIWEERDNYKPDPGDIVLYDWDDSGAGNNHGWPDHVGIVISASSKHFYVIEGNMGSRSIVGYRELAINNRFIRGFILPKYDKESSKPVKETNQTAAEKKRLTQLADDVIRGKYGAGAARKKALGADYEKVQKIVNQKMKRS